MTMFDERERVFEKKYSMDQEFKFKARARRDKLVAEWAAAKLGLSGLAVSNYVKEVVDADVLSRADGAYVKLETDLSNVGVAPHELQKVMDDYFLEAVRQLNRKGNGD